MLELQRTTDYGKSFKTVAAKIYSFGLGGKFLFASVMTGKVSGQLCIIRYLRQHTFWCSLVSLLVFNNDIVGFCSIHMLQSHFPL